MSKTVAKSFLFVLLVTGLFWAKSSYGKFLSGNFASSLGGSLSKVLDKNPYPFFKQFLTTTIIPNSQMFGLLVFWGEFLTAVSIIIGSLILLFGKKWNKVGALVLIGGLIGGFFLNMIFWLGFGYTSASTDSLNLLMAVIEVIGIAALMSYLFQKD